MRFDTYFGLFAQTFFTALAGAFSRQTGKPLVLLGIEQRATNLLKLRGDEIEAVLTPRLAEKCDVPFVVVLKPADVAAMKALAGAAPLQRVLEQAVAAGLEPLNFVSKVRNRLTGLGFSPLVTGLLGHHLAGETHYTMAVASLGQGERPLFELRLLVPPQGRDLIEQRAQDPHAQRAFHAILEGGYVCRPQLGQEQAAVAATPPEKLPGLALASWFQVFFALNGGLLPPRMFQQPASLTSQLEGPQALIQAGQGGAEDEELPVVRLRLNQDKGLEVYLVFPPGQGQAVASLSKSQSPRFVGDFFRVLQGEAAGVWQRLAQTPLAWELVAVKAIPARQLGAVAQRVAQGGVVLRQRAQMADGKLHWLAAIPAQTALYLARLTAQGVGGATGGNDLEALRLSAWEASGWGRPTLDWPRLIEMATTGELRNLTRFLEQAGLKVAHMAAVGQALAGHAGLEERWWQALPVGLGERARQYQLGEAERPPCLEALTQTMLELSRRRRLEEGRLLAWLTLYGEFRWHRRHLAIEKHLPLRHLVYGLDRQSLSRLLYGLSHHQAAELLAGAEFMVLDQVRRAVSPVYAMRLLDDVAVRRPKTSALAVQEAQVALYKRCQEGLMEGRYLLRESYAKRLDELLRLLEEGGARPPMA